MTLTLSSAVTYATLSDLRRYLALAPAQTADDDLLLSFLGAATRLIERYTVRRFVPRRSIRAFDYTAPCSLALDDDLLDLHALTNGDGTALDLDAVYRQPAGRPVASELRLDPARAVFVPGDTPIESIYVDGTWGYHPDWAAAWHDSGDTLQLAVASPLDMTITVHDADGPTPSGFAPRFTTGQLLRLADEYLSVRAIDTATNTLTVTRGHFGTPAAPHDPGTPVRVYVPPEDIRQVCLRVANWLYRQKDAGFVQTALGLRGQVAVPSALPEDVRIVLAPYVRLRVA